MPATKTYRFLPIFLWYNSYFIFYRWMPTISYYIFYRWMPSINQCQIKNFVLILFHVYQVQKSLTLHCVLSWYNIMILLSCLGVPWLRNPSKMGYPYLFLGKYFFWMVLQPYKLHSCRYVCTPIGHGNACSLGL